MRNTGYNKLQLVPIAAKDWGNFLKLGEIPLPQKPLKHCVGRSSVWDTFRVKNSPIEKGGRVQAFSRLVRFLLKVGARVPFHLIFKTS